MNNTATFLPRTHFRYLPMSALQHPLDFLKEFCCNLTEIELFRNDILQFFKAACTNIHAYGGKYYLNPSGYVQSHQEIIQVIELLWMFTHQTDLNYALPASHPLFQQKHWNYQGIDTERRLEGPARHYRQLTDEEINNLNCFLSDLFTYKDLNEWRETLDRLLYYAHSEDGFGYGSEECLEVIPLMEYLEKIVEAVFLIAEIKIAQTKKTDHPKTPSIGMDSVYKDKNMEQGEFLASLISYLERNGDFYESQQQTLLLTEPLS